MVVDDSILTHYGGFYHLLGFNGSSVQFIHPMHHKKAGIMVTLPVLKFFRVILQSYRHNAYMWPRNLLSPNIA